MNDCHCHFFSDQFFATLGRQRTPESPQSATDVVAALGWETPGTPEELADRWVQELDRAGVGRAAIIGSVPGDETSVGRAVARHGSRFVGFFMADPTVADVSARITRALQELRLRAICLFPAMHRYRLDADEVVNVFEAAGAHGAVV